MKRCEQLEIIFDQDTLDEAKALYTIVYVIDKLGLCKEFEFDSKRIDHLEFLSQVEQKNRWPFEVRSGGLLFRYGAVKAWNHSFVHIQENVPGAAICWDEWVTPFADLPGFIQAWASDSDFDYWQNAKDILQYSLAGRDSSALPTISNELPPPLAQQIIDISQNPGRRIICNGYVEAVGSRMWLSSFFFEKTGRFDQGCLTSAGWQLTYLKNGITLLEVPQETFQEGSPLEKQIALRASIYGT